MRVPRLSVLALALIAAHARADLPLTVEDFITDKGQFKLDLSIAYANADRQGVSTGAPITLQTGPTSFVELPTLIGESAGNSDTTFADAWAGINYQFKKDDETPAVLGFAELALREKHRLSSAIFTSAQLGLTTFTAIDPVVFSFTGAYRFNQRRQDGAQTYKPGNLLLLNPGVAFAVFDRVTLTTGVQWTR